MRLETIHLRDRVSTYVDVDQGDLGEQGQHHEKSRWVPHSLLWGGKRAARRAATISVWPTKQVLMPFMT